MHPAIASFSRHTRQPFYATPTEVARKYVAAHIGGALIYDLVATDYAATKLRTHNPPLESYSSQTIDAHALIELCKACPKSAIELARDNVALGRFMETFFSRPEREEQWVRYADENYRWKPVAYFLAQTAKNTPKFFGLIEAIYKDGLPNELSVKEKNGAADLYTKFKNYKLEANPTAVAAVINELEAPQHTNAPVESKEQQQEDEHETVADSGKRNFSKLAEVIPIGNDIDLSEFRQKNASLIAATADPKKILKQYTLLALCAEVIPEELLTRQQKLAQGKVVAPKVADEKILRAVANAINLSAKEDCMQYLLTKHSPQLTQQEATWLVMQLHSCPEKLQGVMDARVKKGYLERFPTLPKCVVEAVMKL